jgi:hypothetical protein
LFPLLLQFESPPLSGIVTALDIVKDIRSGLGSGPVLLPVHSFPLKHAKKLSAAALSAQLPTALML